jgi:hypothetical protein
MRNVRMLPRMPARLGRFIGVASWIVWGGSLVVLLLISLHVI